MVGSGGMCCVDCSAAFVMNGRTENQEPGVIAARSRWRRTIVVVRQFSFVATSRSQPPAGMRSGVERAALSMQSRTGRPAWPVFVSLGLFSVVMVFSPLAVPPLETSTGEGWNLERTVSFPRSFRSGSSVKEGHSGESVPEKPSFQVMVR